MLRNVRSPWQPCVAVGINEVESNKETRGKNYNTLGKYFCFCASFPLRTSWLTHKLLWAP